MNYEDALGYIESLKGRGIVPGLDNIKRLCEKLDNPQDSIKIIHIAGTNGKGSTGAYISSILLKSGFCIGRYVSPAVEEYREIFTVNGEYISEEDYIKCIKRVQKACAEIEKDGFFPTSFEVETAVAFVYFNMKKCDYAVIECGMGGRFDATNVISKPECAVITSITADHTAFLGNTLAEIAFHKSGIIKNGCKAVSANQTEEVLSTLRKECEKMNVLLEFPLTPQIVNSNICGIEFLYGTQKLHTTMTGIYQPENAALAIKAVKCLDADISDADIADGIADAKWKYRFEVYGEKPYWIFDGAHNADGMNVLSKTLKEYFSNGRLVFIFGMFKDKEYVKAAEMVASMAKFVYTVKPYGDRGLLSEILADEIAKYNKNVLATDIKNAVKLCKNHDCDAVVCCGSLSFLAQIKKEMGII